MTTERHDLQLFRMINSVDERSKDIIRAFQPPTHVKVSTGYLGNGF